MGQAAIHRALGRIGFAICLLAIVAAQPAWAQRHGHDSPEERLERLQQELELTPAQVDQIRPILAEQQQKLHDLKERGGDRGSRRQAFLELREETSERIEAVLTDEQKDRFRELREERRKYHGRYGG